ncbi:kinase-like domain-containing protein [Geranomyces variabilis]|nr:kinase-like domain-containing protein [Geranomyces variabilis]
MSAKRTLSGIATKEDPDTLYELMEHIGTGSYGEVFKARSRITGEMAAIKVIKLEAGEELDEVLHEVNFLRDCNHRNVVSYIGCYMKRGTVKGQKHIWIVMEFCGGGSVEAAYKGLRGPLTEQEVACIIRESLTGLSFLHSCNKMHRDIKCGNILMTESGAIKIADFGVSTQLTRTFSKRHTFIGTPYWMAPEVITAEQQGTAYDSQADIWSLGITAMEMAECSPPMFDMHPMRVLFMIPKLDPPKLKDTSGKWSAEFRDFLHVCLEKDPDKRPTADQLLQHPFMKPIGNASAIVTELVERTREARRQRAAQQGTKNPLFAQAGAGEDDDDEDEDEDDDEEDEETRAKGETVKKRATTQKVEVVGPATNSPVVPAFDRLTIDSRDSKTNTINSIGRSSSTSPASTASTPTTVSATSPTIPTLSPTPESTGSSSAAIDDREMTLKKLPTQHPKDESTAFAPFVPPPAAAPAGTAVGGGVDSRSGTLDKAAKKPVFKASRMCRLTIQVNCAEFLGDTLLLGTDDGLFGFETKEKDSKMIPLSTRRYEQINALEDLNIIISRSGKYDMVATHDLTSTTKFKRKQKFETETKLKKMKETKGCQFYSIAKIKTSIYLCVATPKSLLVLKWAPHPLNRFMKLKEIMVDFRVTSLDITESPTGELRLYAGTATRFKVVDLQTVTVEEIVVPGVSEDKLGQPVRGVLYEGLFVLCYEHMGIMTKLHLNMKENRTLTWRSPLTFADRLGTEYLVAGSSGVVDVINSDTGKIVHVFETKRDKIRSLGLLVCKGEKLFLLAEEEKDGMKTASIILIEVS